jgi:LPS sulfotransferase NodH
MVLPSQLTLAVLSCAAVACAAIVKNTTAPLRRRRKLQTETKVIGLRLCKNQPDQLGVSSLDSNHPMRFEDAVPTNRQSLEIICPSVKQPDGLTYAVSTWQGGA